MLLSRPLLLATIFTCLVSSCSSQVYHSYYCDSPDANRIDADNFTIVTRNQSDYFFYYFDMYCSFETVRSGYYFIKFTTADTYTATLTVELNGTTRFHGDSKSLKDYSKSIFLNSGFLRVSFQSDADHSRRRGFELRVTRVFRCPPGWTEISNYCFGGGVWYQSERLNYTDAQKSCNNMRANLLHVPHNFNGDVRDLGDRLPSSVVYDSWVGITDIQSRMSPYWLDWSLFNETFHLECNDKPYSSSNCYTYQRCAAFVSLYNAADLTMKSCRDPRYYICSMPLLGTNVFYSVPDHSGINYDLYNYNSVLTWIFYPVAAVFVVFVVGAIISFSIIRFCSRNRPVAVGCRGAAVTGGSSSYPTQPPPYSIRVGQAQQQQPSHSSPPSASQTQPPSYETVVGGVGNQTFKY